MTEIKWTPGPWARIDTPDYAEIHPASGKAKSPIALVGRAEDADLIAAAPEMAEALRAEEEADDLFDAADEYTHRADVEGWLNDPTGSLHVTEAWDRARQARERAKELRRAVRQKAGG